MDTATDFDPQSIFVTREQLLAAWSASMRPHVLDVRKAPAYAADPRLVKDAQRCLPGELTPWAQTHSADQPVVVYCVYGHAVSQSAAHQLRAEGFQAWALAGGLKGGEEGVDDAADIARWRQVELPIAASQDKVRS